jgi:hypothetical protein
LLYTAVERCRADALIAAADVWVRGTVETAETRPYCWVKLASDGEEYRLGVDEIELHPDEGVCASRAACRPWQAKPGRGNGHGDGVLLCPLHCIAAEPIAPGKRVILNWEEGGQDEGTVGTVEEEVVYTVLGVGGETIADLTRSRLCPVDDWLTQRPAGAVGDDEQPLDETDDEGTGTPREGEGEGEGLNSTVVDPRFIIERTQRPAAAKAVEETSKLLQDEPLHPPVTTATTPAADKKKPAAEKKVRPVDVVHTWPACTWRPCVNSHAMMIHPGGGARAGQGAGYKAQGDQDDVMLGCPPGGQGRV